MLDVQSRDSLLNMRKRENRPIIDIQVFVIIAGLLIQTHCSFILGSKMAHALILASIGTWLPLCLCKKSPYAKNSKKTLNVKISFFEKLALFHLTFGKSKTNSPYFWTGNLSWLLELNWPATSFPQLCMQLIIVLL